MKRQDLDTVIQLDRKLVQMDSDIKAVFNMGALLDEGDEIVVKMHRVSSGAVVMGLQLEAAAGGDLIALVMAIMVENRQVVLAQLAELGVALPEEVE